MEFRRPGNAASKSGREEIRRRLLSWPDCYYRERDPKIRLEMLDEADAEGLTPEDNAVRRRLHEIRYPSSGPVKDTFLKAWLDMRFLRDNSGSFFFRGKDPKKLDKVLAPLGFAELCGERSKENLLYQELYHLGMLYASLCQEDKGYSSVLFGIGQLSDDKLGRKIGAEFRDIAVNVPGEYDKENKYELWTRAISDAFCDMFPDLADAYRSA